MPRTCTVCQHTQRDEIEAETTNGKPYRTIANRYSVGASSILRHCNNCIGKKTLWRCPGCYGRLIQKAPFLYTCATCGCTWDASQWCKAA